MRDFAKVLIAYEAKGNNASGRNAPTRFGRAVEKLRAPLVALMGVGGFRLLLARALALSNAEVRWLRTVHIQADGSFQLPTEMVQLGRDEIANGEVVLVAHLLGLLVTLIGESLTLGLVQEAWPEAPIDDFDATQKADSKEKK
jgi:hypothetical protein